jgi:hypothetical protein
MPTFNNFLRGGRAVTGNSLDPRARRANTAQADTYWSGVSQGGTDAIGGIGPSVATGSGYRYLQFNSTGALTVTGAGTFEFYLFGGGGGGSQGNGYNGFAQGGFGSTGVQVTKTLSPGTYTVTVGAGGNPSTGYATNNTAGGDSYFDTDTTNKSTGGAKGVAGASGLLNINGAAGTDVSTFIGGSALYKGAGGGNPASGNGGSGVGGNGRTYPSGGTSAAANTASGGGGSNGSGLPDFFILDAGAGGSGIVYVRWRA